MPPPLPAARKFMYPESSVPYTMYMEPEDPEEIFAKLEKPTKLELEPRPTFLKVGAISTVKGSAYMEYGNTKLIASVEPPRELSNKQMKKNNVALGVVTCSLKFAPFATRDVTTIPRKESFMSVALKKALEPMICRHEFPNFQLEIKVMVLDDDGCVLSTAINCCGAALTEGGIPTYDLITASTVCLYKQVTFVNPNATVEQLLTTISEQGAEEEHGIVIIASLSEVGQVAECFQKGYLEASTLERLSEHALAVNKRVLDTVRHVLVHKVKDHIAKQEQKDSTDSQAHKDSTDSQAQKDSTDSQEQKDSTDAATVTK